jgi:hypothetical protein
MASHRSRGQKSNITRRSWRIRIRVNLERVW